MLPVTDLILQMNKTKPFPVYTVLFVLIVAGALTDFFVLRRGDDDSGSPKSAEATPPTKTEPETAEQWWRQPRKSAGMPTAVERAAALAAVDEVVGATAFARIQEPSGAAADAPNP